MCYIYLLFDISKTQLVTLSLTDIPVAQNMNRSKNNEPGCAEGANSNYLIECQVLRGGHWIKVATTIYNSRYSTSPSGLY